MVHVYGFLSFFDVFQHIIVVENNKTVAKCQLAGYVAINELSIDKMR